MMNTRMRRAICWLRVASLSYLLLLPPSLVSANPYGGVVVDGSAAISQNGAATTINQATDRAIINWQGFSINQQEVTRFNLPTSSSAVLNRVIGADPSAIMGALRSNGNVYLINPHGIVFGANARIDVNGIVASTLDVANSEFMNGGALRFHGDSQASVINHGHLRALGGNIFLIARNIQNTGVLEASNGTVGLAAGGEVLLVDSANPAMVVQPSAKSVNITNKGTIDAVRAELIANGGNVYALAINNEGIVRATGVVEKDGRILLKADTGDVKNSGDLIAKNSDGSGGAVKVYGPEQGAVRAPPRLPFETDGPESVHGLSQGGIVAA